MENEKSSVFPEETFGVVSSMNQGSSIGFSRVDREREFKFPRDHGAHPNYKYEWWYFTGNLQSKYEQSFGYQLTIFRVGLRPDVSNGVNSIGGAAKASEWRSNHVYMAHFTLTDVDANKFYNYERFARGSMGLAGAEVREQDNYEVVSIWLDDWSIQSKGNRVFPLGLVASEGDISIDLKLEQEKPIILQGDNGLYRRSSQNGHAAYYYSITRLKTEGVIKIGTQQHYVRGNSWFDREWSTSGVSEQQKGWNWYSIHLSDGRDIMFYQLLKKDGSQGRYSQGVVVDADGTSHRLLYDAVRISSIDEWTSPNTGITYPSKWNFEVPDHGLKLTLIPIIENQEVNLSVRYWEGSVRVIGYQSQQLKDDIVGGQGYVELAGYDE